MYPLGLLFGLGFDTATEIGLLGLAATAAAKGLPLWCILIFPTLFAAGMGLADTLEGLFMLGAYRWTSTRPRTQLYYNLAATAASIGVGLSVAVLQLVRLDSHASLGPLSLAAKALSARSEWAGGFVVILFGGLWAGCALVGRRRGARPPRVTPVAFHHPARAAFRRLGL